MDFNKQLHAAESSIASIINGGGWNNDLPSEDVTPEKLAEAIESFLQIGIDSFVENTDEAGRWVHTLSHFTDDLWKAGERGHLKTLYREAVRRSDATGNYGCMDRLLLSFMKFALWNDHPCDYGYRETVPDYEILTVQRDGNKDYDLKRIAERGDSYEYRQKLITTRLKGFGSKRQYDAWVGSQIFFQTKER